jgi:hypothetical protein
MTTDREVMQQALDALEAMNPYPASKEDQRACAIAALRACLAEPETCKPALQVERTDPRRPLTDEEIHFIARHECFLDFDDEGKAVELFARAIERAHKIGGNDD